MRRVLGLLCLCLIALPTPTPAQDVPPPVLRLSEIVADPQQDWNEDGRVGPSDEFVELENPGADALDLTGWRLFMNDTTPSSMELAGRLEANGRLVVWNPTGEINNNGHVALFDPRGTIADEVRFGSWTGNTANVPTADAHDAFDESLHRGATGWRLGHATPGHSNDDPQASSFDGIVRVTDEGWVAPGLRANLSIRAIHSREDIVGFQLWRRDANATLLVQEVPVPAGRNASATVEAAWGTRPFAYAWRIETSARRVKTAWTDVRVDGEPPVLPLLEAETVTASNTTVDLPDAVDLGVGGVQMQVELEDDGTVTTTDWASAASIDVSDRGDGWVARVRVRAQDAFGTMSPWSNESRLLIDRSPPLPPKNFTATGDGPVELRWDAPGADVARQRLCRADRDGTTCVELAPNVANRTDAFTPTEGPVGYELAFADRAGNLATTQARLDYARLHPSLVGVRRLHEMVTGSRQEVRFDFDRAMDASAPVSVRVAGPQAAEATGRFLANRTTFFVEFPDLDPWPDGAYRVDLEGARSADGFAPRFTPSTTFVADHTPPRVSVEPRPGWTNARAVRIVAADEVTGHPRVAWSLADSEGSAIAAGQAEGVSVATLPADGTWTLRANATDEAGLRSLQWRGDYRIDREPPTLARLPDAEEGARWIVKDLGSGVNWSSVAIGGGLEVRVEPAEHRLTIDALVGPVRANLSVADKAGNVAFFELELARTAAPDLAVPASAPRAAPKPTTTTTLAASPGPDALAALADRATPGEGRSSGPWLPLALSLLGLAGLAVPVLRGRRKARRRRTRQPSLARRLKTLRAAAGLA